MIRVILINTMFLICQSSSLEKFPIGKVMRLADFRKAALAGLIVEIRR